MTLQHVAEEMRGGQLEPQPLANHHRWYVNPAVKGAAKEGWACGAALAGAVARKEAAAVAARPRLSRS